MFLLPKTLSKVACFSFSSSRPSVMKYWEFECWIQSSCSATSPFRIQPLQQKKPPKTSVHLLTQCVELAGCYFQFILVTSVETKTDSHWKKEMCHSGTGPHGELSSLPLQKPLAPSNYPLEHAQYSLKASNINNYSHIGHHMSVNNKDLHYTHTQD